METSGMTKKEYLKKYLSGGEKKKKKKKSTQSLIIKSRVVDDDIDLKNMKPIDNDELEIYDLAEEAPQIVGIIDERPPEVRLMSEYRSTKKWKIVTDENGIEDVKITAIDRRKSDVGSPKVDKEISIEIRKSTDKKVSDSDESPPRQKENSRPEESLIDISKVIRQEVESESSVPRKSKKDGYDSDASLSRRPIKREKDDSTSRSKKEDSDASPPRKSKKKIYDSDASPPRKPKQKNYDSDSSPSRRSKQGIYDSDVFPPRKSKKRNHDSDKSSPRNSKKKSYDSSSKRINRKDKALDSSPRRKIRSKNDSDSSSPRRQKDDSDSSLPRKSASNRKSSSSHHRRRQEESSRRSRSRSRSPSVGISSNHKNEKYTSKMSGGSKEKKSSQQEKTLSGKKAGLQSAEEMRKESEKLRQKEREMLEKMSDDLTGRHAAAVVRNRKTGRRHDPKEEARKKREREEKEAEKIAQYAVWGKGVKQVQDRENKIKDDLYEMSKPLARYKDDKDLDEMLKNQEREGDPMLEYIRRKKKTQAGPSVPQYQGNYPPNRYGIKPGHKWDGVDRSNGYEKKWFDEQSARKAREEEAFKWSTVDM